MDLAVNTAMHWSAARCSFANPFGQMGRQYVRDTSPSLAIQS
jgi:hypothetical protein